MHADGRPVGKVTNVVHSPRLGKNIGYAWVPIGLADLSTKFDIESPLGSYPAVVAPLPFHDPKKEVPRA